MLARRGHLNWALAVFLVVGLGAILSVPAQQTPASSTDSDPAAATGNSGSTGSTAPTASPPATATAPAAAPDSVARPLIILVLGVAIVLGAIIVFKINAFIALISAAIFVSLCAPGNIGDKIDRVARAFGGTCGGIGIVIAMAAVIGKCMLDSGAADRIVRAFVRVLGEKRAPVALMGSGYVLAIPVFFDTVFYLLVPLARSLHQRTRVNYLKYILAIAAGGAITHTLVPPTPGPLLMASTLDVDLGVMILIGALVALPAALAGLIFATIADGIMKTPMRRLGTEPDPDPLTDDQLPPLWLAALPVALPVLLISINTICTTLADLEPASRVTVAQITDPTGLVAKLTSDQPGMERIRGQLPEPAQAALSAGATSKAQQQALVEGLNVALQRKSFYNEQAFLGVQHQAETKKLLGSDRDRMRKAELEHLNRLILEEALEDDGDSCLADHVYRTPRRVVAEYTSLIGNANLALLLSTMFAIWTLVRQRKLSRMELAEIIETSLMSGGVIILITSGGGAFGEMLKQAQIGMAVETIFGGFLAGSGGGMKYLLVGFLLASVLKIAQGSSTVAMIVGSSMMAAIVTKGQLGFHPVYLATAIGAGSLVGSWMNDSGFWIFAKMGGLSETEALKSWTLLLVVLGVASFLVTLLLATFVPLT